MSNTKEHEDKSRAEKQIAKDNRHAISEKAKTFLSSFSTLNLSEMSGSELAKSINEITQYQQAVLKPRTVTRTRMESEWPHDRGSREYEVQYKATVYGTDTSNANLDIAKIPNAQIIAQLLDAIQKQAYMDEHIEQYRQLRAAIDVDQTETLRALPAFIDNSKISSEDWASYQPLRRDVVIQNVFDSIEREDPTPKIFSGLRAMMPNASIRGYVEPVLNAFRNTLYRQFTAAVETTVNQLEISVDRKTIDAALDNDVLNVFAPVEKREGLVMAFAAAASELQKHQAAIAVLESADYERTSSLKGELEGRLVAAKATLIQGILVAADSQPQEAAPA